MWCDCQGHWATVPVTHIIVDGEELEVCVLCEYCVRETEPGGENNETSD